MKTLTIVPNDEAATLRRKVEEMEKKLQKQPQTFAEKLEYFNLKREQIKRLQTITSYKEQIITNIKGLEEAAANNVFTTDDFSIALRKKSSYRDADDLIKVSQPAIILEVVNFLLAKVEAKEKELKNLIEA